MVSGPGLLLPLHVPTFAILSVLSIAMGGSFLAVVALAFATALRVSGSSVGMATSGGMSTSWWWWWLDRLYVVPLGLGAGRLGSVFGWWAEVLLEVRFASVMD